MHPSSVRCLITRLLLYLLESSSFIVVLNMALQKHWVLILKFVEHIFSFEKLKSCNGSQIRVELDFIYFVVSVKYIAFMLGVMVHFLDALVNETLFFI